MALVGDAIVKFRAEAPDASQVMGPPVASLPGGAINASGTLVLLSTVYTVVTAVNQWGESLGDIEVPVTLVGAQNSISIFAQAPPGATGGRAYFGTTSGNENQWIPLTLNATTGALTGTILGLVNSANVAGAPPVRSSAFLPDTDGDEVSATLAFLWLNDGLTLLSRKAGGLLDTTGLNAIAQQQYYVVPGRWQRFVTYWFLGWEIQASRRADGMYRYNISGVPEIVIAEIRAQQSVISFNPQPNQPGNTDTLSAPMGLTDTVMNTVGSASFQPLGRVQVDNEQILFSQDTGLTLTGCIRGIGGSLAATHKAGATIQELGLWLTGFRYPNVYAPGMAIQTLDAAPSWEVPLHKYLLARYLKHCQLDQEAAAMMKEFDQDAKELETENPGIVRAMQMGAPAQWFDRGLSHRVIVQ